MLGEDVLVVGGGPSGMDLVKQLASTANRATLSMRRSPRMSKRSYERRKNGLPATIQFKEEIKRFTQSGAEFSDGSHQSYSVIIFATGYDYVYPFLGKNSGISVDDNYVSSLFKQIINIEYPTMAFIGLVYGCASAPTYDLQVDNRYKDKNIFII